MWSNNDLSKMLGVEYPIIQAPMAIVTTPELASAVAKAGGLGSLGCAVLTADEIAAQVTSFRHMTDAKYPIHLNFFVHKRPSRNPEADALAIELLAPIYKRYGAGDVPTPSEVFFPFDDEKLQTVLDLNVEIVSFHFGLPSPEAVEKLKSAGVRLLSSATTVQEAVYLERNGVDVVIAQTWEAGGHRGTFQDNHEDGTVGAISLIPQIADAISVPIVAAGGIADGRGAVAAFVLGASGVQLGTAFLRCPESNVTEPHRNALKNSSEDQTRLTRAFSGRPARSLRNAYLDELAVYDHQLPEFPLMNPMSKPLRIASDQAGLPDCLPLWSGQSAPMAQEKPAADVVVDLVADIAAQFDKFQRGAAPKPWGDASVSL